MNVKLMKEAIGQQRARLANDLRVYCRAQVDLWRLVPWLALQADGRSGWSSIHSRAYWSGLWTLPVVKHGVHCVFVDLLTGELTNAYPRRVVTDDVILELDPAELDAEEIVKGLREQGSREYWKGYDVEDTEKKKEEIIEKTNLTSPYSEKCKSNADERAVYFD